MSGARLAAVALLALVLVAGPLPLALSQETAATAGILSLFVPIINLFRGTVRLSQDLIVRSAITAAPSTAPTPTITNTTIFSDGDISAILFCQGTATGPVDDATGSTWEDYTYVAFYVKGRASSYTCGTTYDFTDATPTSPCVTYYSSFNSYDYGYGNNYIIASDGRTLVVDLYYAGVDTSATVQTCSAVGTLSYVGPSPLSILPSFFSNLFGFFSSPTAAPKLKANLAAKKTLAKKGGK